MSQPKSEMIDFTERKQIHGGFGCMRYRNCAMNSDRVGNRHLSVSCVF